ncbi:DUF3794 domain-containing protein [uncultured Ruminococcus sp.]|uniref:DUF3794 and LysM peptidoglycan-binding domain-containing protein n=1 Tax=uncultured Ruminococcus sp. TaxID=165186 RepID=UPI002605F810|nr:DUF3794 domain-containing protein [uncultured Ruminococcus sp.]
MDLKINREMIPVTETILDDMQEQSVELDYVLPDYDPDIFRIIGCEIQPTVVNYTTGTDRITYELRADIRVLYCGSGSTLLQCVSQQMTFSRSIELPRPTDSPTVHLRPKTTYANCRAVSPRRLEVRGAVSVQIRITGDRKQEVIRDVFGMHVQLRKIPVEYAAQKRCAMKNMILSEDIELGTSKPPIRNIVRSEVRLDHQEQSILAGKLIVKGEAEVHFLYTWQREDGSNGLDQMQFTIPYSQIVDMEQIDDSYRGNADVQVIRCDLKPTAGKNGAMDLLQCEIELRMRCTAVKTAAVQLVTDAFSTLYPCEQSTVSLQIDMAPEPVHANLMCNATLHPGDTIPECIYDLHCQVRNINMQLLSDTNRIRVSGMLCCSLLARDTEGMPMLLEKEEAFEVYTDSDTPVDNATLQAQVEPTDCTYHLASDGTISVKANLLLHGTLCPSARHTCLSDLTVDGENKLVRDGDYALKLYYGVEHENVWDIAKRCHTSVGAIMEENELTDEQLTTPGMLFIPIVH